MQSGKLVDEQDFRVREKSGAMASALVLHNHAQGVWQGSYARQDADEAAGAGLGRHRDGGGTVSETQSVIAVYSTRESPHGCARGLSVLSRHQFCRWQKSRLE